MSNGKPQRKSTPPQLPVVEEHPFLTARHVDNLTDAVRLLSATIVRTEEQRRTDHREHMEALRAFAELIRPNGAGRAEPNKETADADRPDR